jgi:hypothetical protein
MKRFWLVLLSLGLVLAFSASAFAVDVKFSGSFYAAGMYLDKDTLVKYTGTSTAFYFQRLQLTAEFIAAPGVSLITTANVMKRAWGANRSAPGTTLDTVGGDYFTGSAATRAENENIGFDYGYIKYASPIGLFEAGYMPDYAWGTIFHDELVPQGKLVYILPIDKWIFGLEAVKVHDKSYTANNSTTISDSDMDRYYAFFVYRDKNFEGGLLYAYFQDATNRIPPFGLSSVYGFKSKFNSVQPYVKATVGPVKIQAEVDYYFGDIVKFDDAPAGYQDQKLQSLAGWIDAVATFGPVYVGGTFAYSQGQGNDSSTLNEWAGGGKDWSPTLIMWNSDRNYWVGNINGNGTPTSKFKYTMTNAFFYQVRAGLKPTDKADICVSAAFAQADTLNNLNGSTQQVFGSIIDVDSRGSYVSKDYGTEIDVTATYKITNNLSYMLGFGYLITGDYFKGTSASNQVENDYLIINKLTLTF